MEILLEFLIEFVLEGSFALFSEKKVPMWLRILAALVVLAFFGGIVGLIIYGGITNKNPLVVGIGVFIAIIGIIAFLHAWNKQEEEA